MIRTGYSFHLAVGSLADVISRIKEIGWTSAPIVDHYSTFGFTRWTKACEKEELKPVYGVEIPCCATLGDKKQTLDNWKFLAIDSIKSLHDLVWRSGQNPGREPCLTYDQAMAAEGVYIIAGERLLVDELPPLSPRFYGALAPSTPKGLVRRMVDREIPLIAISDNYFPRQEDKELYRVGLGQRRANTQTYPQWIMSDEELKTYLSDDDYDPAIIDMAFANRDAVLSGCNAKMKKAKLLVPEKLASLRDMCFAGAKAKGVDIEDPVYAARLERELNIINEKDFEDYFYIVSDIIRYAKSIMVVGPARGSSCGSLVCYLLDITSIDPIPYGLIFERFIDINRADLPDVDIDFSDAKRHMVFKYAEEKYGRERVAKLGTVGMFQAKSALNAAAISLKVPSWRVGKLADSIIVRQPGDARYNKALEDTLNTTDAGQDLLKEHPEMLISASLEGHPQNASMHAAGLLLTADPIAEYVAVDYRSRGAWCDKKDAEDLNLLKIDALGLTQLSIFERTLELIGEKPTTEWLNKIPLDDPKAFEVLNQGKYNGIFQFAGMTVRSLASKIIFDKLDDLVAISSIARPGSMDSGGADAWIRRRNGERVPEFHPIYDRITADTYGVIVYQETVMFLCRELAGFDWPDTSAVRKAIGKKLGHEELEAWRAKFVAGCVATNGINESDASNIWTNIVTFGTYGFNKSHAVAYGVISYWCCWLKAHYPVAFAAATLDAEADAGKQIAILRELDKEGIGYVPVDPDKSTDRWTIDGDRLIGPLTAIKGLGSKKVQEILNSREGGEPLKPGVKAKLEKAETAIDSLYPVADKINSFDLEAMNILSKPVKVEDIQCGISGDFLAIVRINRITPKDENSDDMKAKRGGRELTGPTKSINLFVGDDTDEIFAKIDRYKFDQFADAENTIKVGPRFLKEAKSGKSIYAIKGRCPHDFRMISILNIRYLGDME